MDAFGKLYLIPTTLGSFDTISKVLPEYNKEIIFSLDTFIVEQLRSARRFLSSLKHPVSIDDMEFMELNKHTDENQVYSYLDCVNTGKSVGLLSEAGTPCIADPGSLVVKMAHENAIEVVPLVGPNSIILALMASGFNGQNFAFHGYLPVDKNQLTRKIKDVESAVYRKNQTQIFIETPYRNNQLIKSITSVCSPKTRLCVATDLTLPSESVHSYLISDWKKMKLDFHKKPSVILIYK